MNTEELEKLSDLDINFKVAKLAGELLDIPKWCEPLVVGDKMCYYDEFRNVCERHSDYCDSYECMMPLVFDNNIGLFPSKSGEWEAGCYFLGLYTCFAINSNPLRASAIAYLAMKG